MHYVPDEGVREMHTNLHSDALLCIPVNALIDPIRTDACVSHHGGEVKRGISPFLKALERGFVFGCDADDGRASARFEEGGESEKKTQSGLYSC